MWLGRPPENDLQNRYLAYLAAGCQGHLKIVVSPVRFRVSPFQASRNRPSVRPLRAAVSAPMQLKATARERVRAPLSGVRSVRSLGEGAARAPRVPEPWRSGVLAAVAIIEDLDAQITEIDRELKAAGVDHRYIPL